MPFRVLIVDDDPDSRSICTAFLRHFRYEVVESWDGEDGVRLATELLPDLIVMDVTLPRLNGWEATRMLKSAAATADIPVIMLTARALVADREESLRSGCSAYLTKPCPPRDLHKEIERVLGERGVQGTGSE